jgi:3-oxosteroid 1-dehydrogenase
VGDRKAVDLVVVGAGFGGLTCALTAVDLGLSVVVLERSEYIGGAAAFSGGQVWVPDNDLTRRSGLDDSVEAGLDYVFATALEHPELLDKNLAEEWLTNARLAAGFLETAGAVRWSLIPEYPDYYYPDTPGSLASGRYLTSAPTLLAELGDAASRVRRSPHFPSGLTYGEILGGGATPELIETRRSAGAVTFGEGLTAQLYRALLERGLEVRFGHRAVAPICEGNGITGVVSESPQGKHNHCGAVVLACSTYEWSPEHVQRFYGVDGRAFGSLAPITLEGDAIDIVERAGGAIRAFPRHLAPMLPAYRSGPTTQDDPGLRSCLEHCLPHSIIVDESGLRFCDDSFYRSITAAVFAGDTGMKRFFLVWDEQHHARYGLGVTPPGGDYPAALVSSASSLFDLGPLLGIDGTQLEATVEQFNRPARAGTDPLFGRGTNATVRRFRGDPAHEPNPLLGPLEKAPYFGMELQLVGTGIGSAGALTGASGRVLRDNGATVEGLYAIGPAAAPLHTGSSYNSGYTLSRTMTYGYLAAVDIARSVSTDETRHLPAHGLVPR